MNKNFISMPYGRDFVSLRIPPENFLGVSGVAESKPVNVSKVVSHGLVNFPKDSITGKILLVIPDATRKAHLNKLLPEILSKIKRKADISIIVATGLHKPLDSQQLTKLVGKTVAERFKVYSHSQKKEGLVYRGKANQGTPIFLNKKLAETDSIITVGVIEPHLYAGYSGGAKTIAIGLAGEETINFTHHPRFLDKNGTSLGNIKDNPFQEALWEIIRGLPIKYSLQIVNDSEGNLLNVFSGSLKDTFSNGVKFARKIFEEKVRQKADAVICGIGYPKDINLYQASRAFNYILNTQRPIVKKDGYVLVYAKLDDGWGGGVAERRFKQIMKDMGSAKGYIEKVKKSGCLAGEHRAYMVARALTNAKLGFIGERAKFFCGGTLFLSFENLSEAIHSILKNNPPSKFYIVPRALSSIIRLKGA